MEILVSLSFSPQTTGKARMTTSTFVFPKGFTPPPSEWMSDAACPQGSQLPGFSVREAHAMYLLCFSNDAGDS